MDRRALLLELTETIGMVFGTDSFSLFLHSIVRMQVPEVIVELGTGLAVSALWMASGTQKNGKGHVWTVDNFEYFDTHREKVCDLAKTLREKGIITGDDPGAAEFYSDVSKCFELDDHLTFVKSAMVLEEKGHFDRYPFADKSIDLLFSDFKHDGATILAILGHFLPRMSPSSSIFIHSASTSWSSFLLLEHLCTQLNSGRIPKTLQDFCSKDLGEVLRHRRIVLVHLTERKDSNQNSAAWLKIEPVDVFPQPYSLMRR